MGGESHANISASMDPAAQLVERLDPVPGHRSDCLHGVEYATTREPKAIVKSLWVGGDVMVIPRGH